MSITTNKLTDRQKCCRKNLPYAVQNSVDLLGEGAEGVVFCHQDKVYKVYDQINYEDFSRIKVNLRKATKMSFVYPIESFEQVGDAYVMVYPYEESINPIEINTDEWINLLAEFQVAGLIVFDIKPSNFIRTKTGFKLIDYNLHTYNDNYFLNMCVRAFIYDKYHNYSVQYITKLTRSAINQFNLEELDGVQNFVNRVYLKSIYLSSKKGIMMLENSHIIGDKISIPFDQIGNIEDLFFKELRQGRYITSGSVRNLSLGDKGYLTPKEILLGYHSVTQYKEPISLVIKTCSQDCDSIYANVCHIVKQLSSPHLFCEYILSIDTRTKDFLRQYNKNASWDKLLSQVNLLIERGIIDNYFILPTNEIAALNERWFGKNSSYTHSQHGAPITSQLYLFEKAKGKYILQMDSDVLIGRDDIMHNFIDDMVCEIKKHPKVVSVGFNIYQENGVDFKSYFGYENGGFVPEIRMGLFDKERMLSMLPFYNKILDKGWEYTWHRTMHIKQKELGMSSIRGGDRRTFYIHPQNYRKSNPDVWLTILDRVEQGYIPDCQYGEFDCMGSFYDWCIPKRNEPYVFVCTVRNINYDRFMRMLASLLSQKMDSWGLILIDDSSDNGLSLFIEFITKPFNDRITYIKNRKRCGGLSNHYKAIHYFIKNQNTVIITLDGDDALIGNNVLYMIAKQYERGHADVVIGRTYQNYRLQPYYRYPTNFVNPRETGGNVWQHIRSFRKYLFDSLDLRDLKKSSDTDTFKNMATNSMWFDDCADFAFMVPIIEMSQKPYLLDQFTYYYDRDIELYTDEYKQKKEKNISYILTMPSKSTKDVQIGRRLFRPNMNKIEIDITYVCNLGCDACNRSCSQAPTKEQMDIQNIKCFIKESIELKKKWDLINVLGGEPTLHPQIEEIISCLIEKYIRSYSRNTKLQIVSNGYTEDSRNILNKLSNKFPEIMVDTASFKISKKVEYFTPFNDAPVDDPKFSEAEFYKGCWVTSFCGIGLNRYGYYACSVCASIDRVLNIKRNAINSLYDITVDKLTTQLDMFCRYCGNFKDYDCNQGLVIPRSEKAPLVTNKISRFWEKAYDNYKKRNDG